MTKEEILNKIYNASGIIEYASLCDRIKKENNNGYPKWWFKEVIMSGLIDRIPGCSSNPLCI